MATQPNTFIGLEDVVLQRTVQLVTTSGSTTSTMTVQINENGEYAVNSWVISERPAVASAAEAGQHVLQALEPGGE